MLHVVLHVRWRWDHEPPPARGLAASLDLADGTFKGAVLLPRDTATDMGICEIREMTGKILGASFKEGHKPQSAALPCSSQAS